MENSMTKRKRRTKAEMEAARVVESQGIGFRDIFDVLDDAPKPKKRKRRTKAQIAKDNANILIYQDHIFLEFLRFHCRQIIRLSL